MSKIQNPRMHNVRFYKPKPKAVYCMALQPHSNKLAVSRSDACLEIWNLKHCPFIERRIASFVENYSIEGLAWCDNRLFSVGLHGLLIEYDLYKLDIKSRAVVTGEAAFCLDVNKQKNKIAVGTEQGYLNIFQIVEDDVLFEKFLDKQEGRILCIKFDHSGEFVVSGSLDAIRIWSVKTNQALHKMITGRAEHNKPTIVWCLAVTQDFTILSGDSRGILTVWDGKVGAQLDSYQTHQADILSLVLSEDESALYCAGTDPLIVNYVRIKVKDDAEKWVRSIHRKIHDHDIRALALHGNKLYSSGVDGYLACSYHPPKTLLKFPPILPNCVTICSKVRFAMLRYPKYLEIWMLGESGGEKDKHTGLYSVNKKPQKIAVIQKTVKTDDVDKKEGIICATISQDGSLILYSTRLGSRLLKLLYGEGTPKLIPIEMTDDLGEVPSVNAIFLPNNWFVLAPNSGGLFVVGFDGCTPALVQKLTTHAAPKLEDTVSVLAVSDNGQFLVAGDAQGNIAVWTRKDEQFIFYQKLPKYKASPTALAVHPKLNNVVVAFSSSVIIEYDLDRRELTKFSRILSKNPPKQLASKSSVIRNITFDPRVDHVIILHDDDSVFVIDKEKTIAESKKPKIAKIENGSKDLQQFSVKVIKKYKHLVHLSWLSQDEMVSVEVNPLSLLEQLPPCLIQNTFGRK